MAESGLLRKATEAGLYRVNTFRVTGLPVDATPQDVLRRLQLLQMQVQLGIDDASQPGPLSLVPPPPPDALRAAAERFHEPEARLVDELFWFWPANFGQGRTDPSLRALERGEIETARRLWGQAGSVGRHNLAVLAHALVLDREQPTAASTPGDDSQRGEKAWDEALGRWNDVMQDDLVWDHLRRRIQALNQPQLSEQVAGQTRDALPGFLAGINVQLAVEAADKAAAAALRFLEAPERERKGIAREEAAHVAAFERQRGILARAPFERSAIDRAIRQALRPIREKLKTLCRGVENLQPNDYTSPALKNGHRTLELFRHVYPLASHEVDRESLLTDAAPALRTLCWFCLRRVGGKGERMTLWLYRYATRHYCVENVPRCWHCRQAHRGAGDLPPGVRPENDKKSYPGVRALLDAGWELGPPYRRS